MVMALHDERRHVLKRRRIDSPSPRKDYRSKKRNYSYRSSPKEIDTEGHLVFKPGDMLGGKYEIIEVLGEGTFGKVVKCVKRGHKTPVAVKIVKGVERYYDAAKIEIKILQKLRDCDPFNESGCIHMVDSFQHHKHKCIVFKLLGLSVYEHMKQNGYRPFPVETVRAISYQLLRSTRFMHDLRLTHTDLKPENMLFTRKMQPTSPLSDGLEADVALIDFGSATFEHESHSGTVSTRHYRAPEVILEHDWSYACDMWSIGCIMFELLTGITMFQTHSNFEHLCMMEIILGPIPRSLLEGSRKARYFNTSSLVNMDWNSSEGRNILRSCKPLRAFQVRYSEEEEQVFNLLEGLLQYEPGQRLTCSQALRHPFFDQYILKKKERESSERNSV